MPASAVFLLARPAVDAEPLAAALTIAGATVARVSARPDMPGPRLAALASAVAGARIVFLAGSADEPSPPELEGIPPENVHRVESADLLTEPRHALIALCAFAQLEYDQAQLSPLEHAARQARELEAAERVAPSSSPFASSSTASFAELIGSSGGSLLVSTYQTHRLVCVRARDGELNTHFRGFDKPMGIAVAPGRIAIGTRTELWDLRDLPAAASTVAPAGTHDACYIARNRHVTGDIAVHDLAFAGGELWAVATAFSTLATLDADHSFVPRWSPPWISRLAPEDRCHLNGLAATEQGVAFVTALGTGDTAGSWREGKASGGVLVDLASGQVAIAGLSMPHSPRIHGGRLWLLESGRGTLCVADLDRGRVETVAELPGFTRGLAFIGHVALVGLSQIRESSTFGDLPVTHRLRERQSGVWAVDLRSGAIVGFLRFEDLVQEIFDVAMLPGARWPEIAEPASSTTALSYVLPD